MTLLDEGAETQLNIEHRAANFQLSMVRIAVGVSFDAPFRGCYKHATV